jgi:hypothetical protein
VGCGTTITRRRVEGSATVGSLAELLNSSISTLPALFVK